MKQLTKRIIDFKNSESTKKLRNLYSKKSLMEIYGINRKEIRHTSFLKWLFSKESTVSDIAVGYLLDILTASKFLDAELVNGDLLGKLILGNYSIGSIIVKENYSNGIKGEIDLLIKCTIDEFDVEIIIENKIYSAESNNQTQRYYDSYNKSKDANTFFVYLTPISSIELQELETPECTCKHFIQINYQNILDSIISPLLKEEDLNNKTYYVLTDYIKALANPVENKKNTHKFMAITKEESDLLTQFWEENKDLIQKAAESLKNNLHVEPSTRDNAKNISEKFDNNGDEKIGKFVQRKLDELASKNLITDDEILKMKDKEESKNLFDIQYPLLIEKTDNISPERYWKKTIQINNIDYWVCCEWFENDREYFVKWLGKLAV